MMEPDTGGSTSSELEAVDLLDKSHILQEAKQCFMATSVKTKKLVDVLTRCIFIMLKGDKLSSTEATDLFFHITRLFQYKDKDSTLRRLTYIGIKALSRQAENVHIVTASLSADVILAGNSPTIRASALRALSHISSGSNSITIERYLRQSIVDKHPVVASAALTSLIRLAQVKGEIVQRCTSEIQEALGSDSPMVQYHALALQYILCKNDQESRRRLITSCIDRDLESPLAICLLIRAISDYLNEIEVSNEDTKKFLTYIRDCLDHPCDMVELGAASALITVSQQHKSEDRSGDSLVIARLRSNLTCQRPALKFASMRLLDQIQQASNELDTRAWNIHRISGMCRLHLLTKRYRPRSFLLSFGGHSSSTSLSSPGLRPSVSSNCLFSGCNDATTTTSQASAGTASSSESGQSSSASLVSCIPTRASLTHEWRKLKTPNKCRECNLLVYFNGRECSCCGFVAHKKCLMVLVIKCSGGQHVPLLSGNSNKQLQQQKSVGDDADAPRSAAARFFSRNATNILLGGSNQTNRKDEKVSDGLARVARRASIHTSTYQGASMVKPLFGKPMVEVDGGQVRDIIGRFIYEIDTRGLTSKGVYRVSSIKSKVDKLCNYYDQNLSSLIDLSSFHPNIIANALKMYLRRLPEPLLTLELYPHFIAIAKKYQSSPASNSSSISGQATQLKWSASRATPSSTSLSSPLPSSVPTTPTATKECGDSPASESITTTQAAATATKSRAKHKAVLLANHQIGRYDPNMLIDEFTQVTRLLPALNRDIVAMLLRHLRRVADKAEENQMSAKNLSIIFGPTLLSSVNNKPLAIADNIHQARVVELMITWANQIFPP